MINFRGASSGANEKRATAMTRRPSHLDAQVLRICGRKVKWFPQNYVPAMHFETGGFEQANFDG
jgi:hypothetical protein